MPIDWDKVSELARARAEQSDETAQFTYRHFELMYEKMRERAKASYFSESELYRRYREKYLPGEAIRVPFKFGEGAAVKGVKAEWVRGDGEPPPGEFVPAPTPAEQYAKDVWAAGGEVKTGPELLMFLRVLLDYEHTDETWAAALACFAVAAMRVMRTTKNSAGALRTLTARGRPGVVFAIAEQLCELTPGSPKKLIDYADLLDPTKDDTFAHPLPMAQRAWVRKRAHEVLMGKPPFRADESERLRQLVQGRFPDFIEEA